MTEKKFRNLLEKYINDTCTPAEKQKVEDFFSLMQEEGISSGEIKNNIALQNKLRKKILEKTQDNTSPKRKRRNFSIPGIAAAIVIFLILSAASVFYLKRNNNHITRIAEKGEQLKVMLSDSSVVYLNSGSKLFFPETFQNELREVKLEGEAYFKVMKNEKSPFVVRSGPFKTEVLGTRFVVNNYQEAPPSVTVASGKVKVTADNETSVYLTRNERVTLDTVQHKLVKETVKASRYTSWTEGEIVFNHTRLTGVAAILSRRFDVDIRIVSTSPTGCSVNGSYSGKNLKDILESLSFIYDITYKVKPDGRIDIFAKPCSTQN
ncbi:FecR domain-containing protein [Sinomicrobium kalidii]|uniref:FecR family protein n=1 Tax=Sinomicrobium kalidii TaxID=2900738 RepID=UPI001E4FB9B0|nr:FecR domain-containing protein [Sinomicrobium kalidii]UGU15084.1 FecR domain-containing protein [Sinomicrobium kalidii]